MYNINIGTKVHLRSYTYISDVKKWKELSRRKKKREEKQKNKQKCFYIYIYIFNFYFSWDYMRGRQTAKTRLVSQAPLQCFS